jgi:hypothetical protein
MLPLPLQFIIAMIAYAINERMARKVEYLQEEVPVLKEALVAATSKSPIAFTPEQRRRLARKGKALTPEKRRACCPIVRPETILARLRQLAAQKYDSSKACKAGRPRKKRRRSRPHVNASLTGRSILENALDGQSRTIAIVHSEPSSGPCPASRSDFWNKELRPGFHAWHGREGLPYSRPKLKGGAGSSGLEPSLRLDGMQ